MYISQDEPKYENKWDLESGKYGNLEGPSCPKGLSAETIYWTIVPTVII